VKQKRILGCFAMVRNGRNSRKNWMKWHRYICVCLSPLLPLQTELGNGSYIQNFETIATFDKEAKQFIINSPTVTSLKVFIFCHSLTRSCI
jgi:hypothetical protein